MDVESVFTADIRPHLAQRFQKRQTLNIPDRTANLHQDHISTCLFRHQMNTTLYFVGDMGDHLNRTT
jgi:hypothetical protein